MRNRLLALFAALFLALPLAPAFAVDPVEQLKDPKLEARAREISEGLRCLVCQNQSIDDSDAPLARPAAHSPAATAKGRNQQPSHNYVADRYGEFVLLKPRLHLNTLLLWLAPLLLMPAALCWPRVSSAACRTRAMRRRRFRPRSRRNWRSCSLRLRRNRNVAAAGAKFA